MVELAKIMTIGDISGSSVMFSEREMLAFSVTLITVILLTFMVIFIHNFLYDFQVKSGDKASFSFIVGALCPITWLKGASAHFVWGGLQKAFTRKSPNYFLSET